MIMTTYDTLYVCPVCSSEHDAYEWNEATEDDFGLGIMPIEVSDPHHEFTCPTCGNVCDIQDIKKK